jgi:Mn2+/Fe2+ NRAMP family transporter
MIEAVSKIVKISGPGLLFASTAIGVSHLIQSTRAGADFGLMIIGFVVLVSVLKYPFFEYGSRYANSTQTSIIDGYKKLGTPILVLYLIITVCSMFFVTGAVGFVTAGFFENLFNLEFLGEWSIILLFVSCVLILSIGKFNLLEHLIKIIVTILVVSTVLAFLLTVINGPIEPVKDFIPKELWTTTGIFFLLSLMGWMPTAIDLSSWNSLWTLEKIKQSKYKPKLKETLLEFRISYLLTGILAIMFVTLGTFIFYGSGEELPNNNSKFAHTIITMYSSVMGSWSYIIIAASAFTVMFGTILAVFDGYSRALNRSVELLFRKNNTAQPKNSRKLYTAFLIILASGSLLTVLQFGDNLKELIDFATILSFVIAPVIAIFNYRLVTGKYLEKSHQPAAWLKILSISGILFLSGFAVYFILLKFIFTNPF